MTMGKPRQYGHKGVFGSSSSCKKSSCKKY